MFNNQNMNQLFQMNNRFDALKENKNDDSSNNDSNNDNVLKEKVRYESRYENVQRMHKFNKKEQIIEKDKSNTKEYLIELNNFPSLNEKKTNISLISEKNVENKICFLEKVKQSITNQNSLNSKKKDDFIKPGWVCLYKDPKTRKTVWDYGDSGMNHTQREEEDEETIHPNDVLNALVFTHENRIAEYDMLWGEGAHEEDFKSPNYDYGYFDRLDDIYEKELEKEAMERELNNPHYQKEEYDEYFN
jgi:hypothetical protein